MDRYNNIRDPCKWTQPVYVIVITWKKDPFSSTETYNASRLNFLPQDIVDQHELASGFTHDFLQQPR